MPVLESFDTPTASVSSDIARIWHAKALPYDRPVATPSPIHKVQVSANIHNHDEYYSRISKRSIK